MANVEGRATAITVLTPVKPGGRFLLALVFWVGRHVTVHAEEAPDAVVHPLRALDRDPALPGRRASGERLNHSYLFFESNFNGLWDQYIDAFSRGRARRA